MRAWVKRQLARTTGSTVACGATLLIYHRVGGGSTDERDVATDSFTTQLDTLHPATVVSLDHAVDRLVRGDTTPAVVLTFDDGFADVHATAWPLLRARGFPFTVYLASGYVGGTMHWVGSTARSAGPALTWDQLAEMVESGLCTVGNHTHSHVLPGRLSEHELDACSAEVETRLGVRPAHFAYTWGVPVRAMEPALRSRFRTAATGKLGRNLPGCDLLRLCRVPVRRTDPVEFFRAKLAGRLGPERAYARMVGLAKGVGARA